MLGPHQRDGCRVFEPFILVESAELARLRGDEVTHRRELREAHRLFTAIRATARAEEVARHLNSLSTATG